MKIEEGDFLSNSKPGPAQGRTVSSAWRGRFTKALAAAAVLSLVAVRCEAQEAAASYAVLHSFTGNDGANPTAGLIQALSANARAASNFYGTTWTGGANNQGTVFKIDASGNFTTLHSFSGNDGATPYGGLIQARDGNFYGTTSSGYPGGTIFKMDASGKITTLHFFTGTDGDLPQAGLIQARDGNFYGTTSSGGASYQGTVFKLDASGNLTTLHSFSGSDGSYPLAGLIQAADGNFYGTTREGGAYIRYGTVFKIDASGNFTLLHSFSERDGSNPSASLIQARDGNFYGTTYGDGGSNLGTIFKMDASGNLTTLHFFANDPDGSLPSAPLIQATDGNFYGTTVFGGTRGFGTVFKMDASGDLTILYSFQGGRMGDGASPQAGLIHTADGNFYGTTYGGGTAFLGVVFRLSGQ